MKNILLGVSGSIAAYKAADIASGLTKAGHSVTAVMTEGAQEFVTPLVLQTLSKNPVVMSFSEEKDDWRPGHISLADSADLLLVAPATANVLAQFANGLAPDVLSAIYLATLAPVLIAPAMNGKMWQHPATQENVDRLLQRGVRMIGPEEGMLACGYEGVGRLWNVEGIIASVESLLAESDAANIV